MTQRYESKPGRHGTLYLYRYTYRDPTDAGAPDFNGTRWAYCAEEILDWFAEAEDGPWAVTTPMRVRAD